MLLAQHTLIQMVAVMIVLVISEPHESSRLQAADQIDVRPQIVERIPPGTVVAQNNKNGWNRTVLLAKPRLASGAVHKVPRLARKYATMFNVAIMARVSSEQKEDAVQYRLDAVGVGYCTLIEGRYVVISSETQKKLGANLDTIARVVLGQNEKILGRIVQIARTKTLAVFDVEALVSYQGEHRDLTVRHMVWVSSPSGKVAALVWLLKGDKKRGYRLAEKQMFAIPENFVEDRIFHVDANEFTLGIPSARAFALVRMPRGKPIPATPSITKWARQSQLTPSNLKALVRSLKDAF